MSGQLAVYYVSSCWALLPRGEILCNIILTSRGRKALELPHRAMLIQKMLYPCIPLPSTYRSQPLHFVLYVYIFAILGKMQNKRFQTTPGL